MSTFKKLAALCLLSLLFGACQNEASKENQLTEKEKSEKWKLLFDGTSTAGWHLYNVGNIGNTWLVKDGTLYCNPDINIDHGDLVSDDSFTNYDLVFDWQIPETGNSGVFVNVLERKDIPTAWASGPEYQLLGDKHQDASIPSKVSGCLFAFGPQLHPAKNKPNGEWNHSEIIQKNGKLSFYLNGTLTAEQDLKAPEWADKIKNSHFKAYPEYGQYSYGRIALQDWTKGVSFRNIKIREL
ncbi:3-keto-disaccharide hydrolase [Mucilaginibacter agri]|uniref:DUF1080 domain-containing protein n=1 Tax=Mucilaginibacter agri TaxID=2695265 RepID=A0A965ZFS8_9SPHI|nr:DUF1080 domain-containing protein [Mucilaginibacter agri]NCD70248.1 DUF1080 domain-containing protein [Mucilaginibacter agri]